MQEQRDLALPRRRRSLLLVFSLVATMACSLSYAVDFTLTGFGTLGYAIADRDLAYLRYIDDDGTLKADSLVGVQAEARFSTQWSATIQAVGSAPRNRDDGVEARIRWAFVSFRPDNDWLIRVGRVRPPALIHLQNAEVGVTYDPVRLPAEIYTVAPVFDFDGAAISKTWSVSSDTEVNVEAYWGKTDTELRDHFQRDPPARYVGNRITSTGAVVSYSSGPLLLRGGFHRAMLRAQRPNDFPRAVDPIVLPGPAPIGGTLYAPTDFARQVEVQLYTLGADWRIDPWRITAEYALREAPDSDFPVSDQSVYVTVARQIGKWTPYITYARLLAKSETRKIYQQIYDTPVPLAAQGFPFFVPENAHRLFGDRFIAGDQYSIMLGASYGLTATSKFKLEWMRTKVGLNSHLVDGEARGKSFNVFSAVYSFAF